MRVIAAQCAKPTGSHQQAHAILGESSVSWVTAIAWRFLKKWWGRWWEKNQRSVSNNQEHLPITWVGSATPQLYIDFGVWEMEYSCLTAGLGMHQGAPPRQGTPSPALKHLHAVLFWDETGILCFAIALPNMLQKQYRHAFHDKSNFTTCWSRLLNPQCFPFFRRQTNMEAVQYEKYMFSTSSQLFDRFHRFIDS